MSKCLFCCCCSLCAVIVVLSIIAGPVLQWLIYAILRDAAGIEYPGDLSFGTSIFSTLGTLMGACCSPMMCALEEEVVKLYFNIFKFMVFLPKTVACICNICLLIDVLGTPGPAESELIGNLLISAIVVEGVAAFGTLFVDCICTCVNMKEPESPRLILIQSQTSTRYTSLLACCPCSAT